MLYNKITLTFIKTN